MLKKCCLLYQYNFVWLNWNSSGLYSRSLPFQVPPDVEVQTCVSSAALNVYEWISIDQTGEMMRPFKVLIDFYLPVKCIWSEETDS